MNANLTNQDWQEVEKRYPDAAAFIRNADLRNEYKYLKASDLNTGHNLNDWQRARLAELGRLNHLNA